MSLFNKITVVANSRAEAGPLKSVIAALPGCAVISSDVRGVDPSTGLADTLETHSAYFEEHKPKIVVVLGDRYETLGSALAAKFARIPVAHIQGGETTLGAFDNTFRDCITHIAELHFLAHPMFITKIMNLGAHRNNVHVVGAPGLDGVPMNSAQRDRRLILVTFHPETLAKDYGLDLCEEMLTELNRFHDYEIIFTGVNADPGQGHICHAIDEFLKHNPNASVNADLDHDAYVDLMQHAAVVVGNSSAGIIEAPWVGVPSINLGNRQKGRPMAPSVWQTCNIEGAMKWSGAFQPAYKDGAAVKIATVLNEWLSK